MAVSGVYPTAWPEIDRSAPCRRGVRSGSESEAFGQARAIATAEINKGKDLYAGARGSSGTA